jgi:hypothetical protein
MAAPAVLDVALNAVKERTSAAYELGRTSVMLAPGTSLVMLKPTSTLK